MAFVLCAPVVAQIGLLGVDLQDGVFEPWCGQDEERWGGSSPAFGTIGEGTYVAACSNVFGALTATLGEDIAVDFDDQFFWGATTEKIYNLQGYRIWTRLEIPDIDAPETNGMIEIVGISTSDVGSDPSTPSYVAVIRVSLNRDEVTGAAQVGWSIQSVGNASAGSVAAVPPTAQWVAIRISPDGGTWWVERSDDCGTWEVLEEFTPGVPGRSLFTLAEISVSGGVFRPPLSGGVVPAGTQFRQGPIWVERVGGDAPEATP